MRITINYATGNIFEDGSPEVGRAACFDIASRADLDRALDTIPDADYSRTFLTGEDGEPVALEDLLSQLD